MKRKIKRTFSIHRSNGAESAVEGKGSFPFTTETAKSPRANPLLRRALGPGSADSSRRTSVPSRFPGRFHASNLPDFPRVPSSGQYQFFKKTELFTSVAILPRMCPRRRPGVNYLCTGQRSPRVRGSEQQVRPCQCPWVGDVGADGTDAGAAAARELASAGEPASAVARAAGTPVPARAGSLAPHQLPPEAGGHG